MSRKTLAAIALALLAGCGSSDDTDSPMGVLLPALVERLRPGATEAPVDARSILTPELIASSSTPVVLIVVEDPDVGLTMVPLSTNLGTTQWGDAVGGGILRRDGILVGTRSLGFDLLTADISGLARALRSGGGPDIRRINRYIDGENQVVPVQYLCDVRAVGQETLNVYGSGYATTKYEEACVGEGPPFTNQYWIQRDGTVRRSVELISPEAGFMEITVLVN